MKPQHLRTRVGGYVKRGLNVLVVEVSTRNAQAYAEFGSGWLTVYGALGRTGSGADSVYTDITLASLQVCVFKGFVLSALHPYS